MNKVMLIGNVGAEPDVRYYEADQAVATVSLATRERGYTLPNGTCVPDRTDWHFLVFYRRLAKVVEQYVHKGDKLYVEGKLQYSVRVDKRGMEKKVAEIVVDGMEMLGSRANVQSAPAAQRPDGGPSQDGQSKEPEAPATPSDDTVLPF